jgi:nucleoid DNA-binding protein
MKEYNGKEVAALMESAYQIDHKSTEAVLKLVNYGIIKALTEQIEAGVTKPRVELHGIGVFKMIIIEEHTKKVRNPKTGAESFKNYPRSVKVSFKPSSIMVRLGNSLMGL